MNKKNIIAKLKDDTHYYGDFGRQYLSNSDISTLLSNPLAFGQPSKPSAAFLVGGYFHTAILEPNKLKKYQVIPSSTRNTKLYKEMSGGELCLLQHEVDMIEAMKDKMISNDICNGLINSTKVLKKNGVIAVVTFHSLEDKIVKYFFKSLSENKSISRYTPLTEQRETLFHQTKKNQLYQVTRS